MAPSRRRDAGRIRPHQRETDDSAPILGANIEIQVVHSEGVRNTEQRGLNIKTKRNYRNRIKEVYTFFKDKYPNYYSVGVQELTEEDLTDPDSFYWKNKHDLIYTGINVRLVKAFLAHKKLKSNGNTSSHVQLRKYHDAILWGASETHSLLPRAYFDEMDKFLQSYRKETVDAKKEGKLDEQEADPISWSLFKLLLRWALDTCNVFVWTYSIIQWNCMARSINIGTIGFHNFRAGEDHIVCLYDDTKADQTGQKVTDKHIYANPFEPMVCPFLGLAVFFSLESLHFNETEKFFQLDGQGTAASQRYCGQLAELFKQNAQNLKAYIRADHANSHGIRKGSATAVTSGTTLPPPTSSIAARGEWSLGRILDLYWHFAEPGDHYLGRCLAGLDPNSADFAVLPPHFTVSNPMENERIREAIDLMYGTALSKWADHVDSDPTALLCMVLPSVVYHSEFLKETIRRVPGHPFAGIPLLNQPALLRDLKALVTLAPSPHVCNPTGIPPHVHHAKLTTSCLNLCQQTLTEVRNMSADVKKAVCDAFEAKAFENGIVTTQTLAEMFTAHHEKMDTLITTRLSALQATVPEAAAPVHQVLEDDDDLELANGVDDEEPATASTAPQTPYLYRSYTHGGRFWHTPPGFVLPPRMKLNTGWKIWCTGIPCYQIIAKNDATNDATPRAAPIRPFRDLATKMVPKDIRLAIDLHWRPIFELMEACPGLNLADADSFERGLEFLKTRVQYVFAKQKSNPIAWELSTWSKAVRHSTILKEGTESDKSHLPPPTRYNKQRSTGMLKRKRKQSNNRRRCQQPRSKRSRNNTNENEDNNTNENEDEDEARQEDGNGSTGSSTRTEEIENVVRRSRQPGSRRPAAAARAAPVDDEEITSILDSMVDTLGINSEVNRGIADMHLDQAAAQQRTRFAHVDEDGNAVLMAPNANRGYGASSRDANYRENVARLLSGQRTKGYCAVRNCQHAEMELLHKCDTCARFVHVFCLEGKGLLVSIEGRSGEQHYCSLLCKGRARG
jgi:hypothetical protein